MIDGFKRAVAHERADEHPLVHVRASRPHPLGAKPVRLGAAQQPVRELKQEEIFPANPNRILSLSIHLAGMRLTDYGGEVVKIIAAGQ